MNSNQVTARRALRITGLSMAATVVAGLAIADTGTKEYTAGGQVSKDTVEWKHLGGSAAHTRYSPAAEITPSNFATLKPIWVWDGASFKAQSGRSTPTYMDGKLFTVAGEHRSVIAIDPATLQAQWRKTVCAVMNEATLSLPKSDWMQQGGRVGRHSEHLGHLLSELQSMQRTFPGATW